MGVPLTIEECLAAGEVLRDWHPRCWDVDRRQFRHLVSPSTLARLQRGELKYASCANCGAVISA